MTIDIKNIKAGDKVALEVEVVDRAGQLMFSLDTSGVQSRYLDPSNPNWAGVANFKIIGHTPKPWEPKAGDVYCLGEPPASQRKIVFIDEQTILVDSMDARSPSRMVIDRSTTPFPAFRTFVRHEPT